MRFDRQSFNNRWVCGIGLALGGIAATANASVLTWSNAAGGSAATSTNWSPVQVPTSVDDLIFNLLATYTVTLPAGAAASDSHTYKRGTVTLNATSPHTIGPDFMRVGDVSGDNADMTLTTGLLNANGGVIIGDDTGSNGILNVDDDDADLIIGGATSDLFVGSNGNGTLNITGLGRVSVADQFIAGSNASSVVSVTVSGSLASPPFGSSTLEVLGASQSRVGQGGDATMTVSNGAFADFASDLIIANGSASLSSITVHTANSFVNARLNVDGDLLIARNISAGILAGNGTLNVNTGGTTTVGGDTFIGDPDGSTALLHMGGGTFNGTGPILVNAGALLNGFGTINSDINNGGDIEPSGTGLTINGVLSNITSNQIVGSKIHFGPDGGYSGSGTCQADISGDASSSITPTAPLTIGANTTSGFFYLGSLNVGSQDVTLSDSNGAVLGGLTTMDGGTLTCASGIGVQNGGAIVGEGIIDGNLTCAGVLDPEDPANTGGLMTVQGNAIMNPSSQLHIRINDIPSSGDNDRVNVTGTASFGGTVHITLAPGVQMHTGQQFILMNATGGRTGEFASVTPTSLCTGVTLVLVYSGTAAILLVRPPDCDPSDDGLVGVTDLLWVINHWGPCGGDPLPECNGDVDGISPPGSTEFSYGVPDLLLIINHWNQCP